MNLSDKHALVTGGHGGLGRAIVEALQDRGARVTILDLAPATAEPHQANRTPAVTATCDITDEHAVASAIDLAVADRGAPDVLVNNAGTLFSAPLVGLGSSGLVAHSTEDWNRVIGLNLTAPFVVSRAVVPHMLRSRRRGVIVNISSIAANGNAGQSAYAASKAGLNALTAVWAKELGPMGIRVVGVAPGFCDTPSTKAAVPEALLADLVKRVPLRRLGKPSEVAQAVVSLIENDFCSGRTLELDGGLVL